MYLSLSIPQSRGVGSGFVDTHVLMLLFAEPDLCSAQPDLWLLMAHCKMCGRQLVIIGKQHTPCMVVTPSCSNPAAQSFSHAADTHHLACVLTPNFWLSLQPQHTSSRSLQYSNRSLQYSNPRPAGLQLASTGLEPSQGSTTSRPQPSGTSCTGVKSTCHPPHPHCCYCRRQPPQLLLLLPGP